MKRLTSLVFSPTGGTQKVTDILAEELMVELMSHPDLQIVETAYLNLCDRLIDFSGCAIGNDADLFACGHTPETFQGRIKFREFRHQFIIAPRVGVNELKEYAEL